jgi:hypothetical protein
MASAQHPNRVYFTSLDRSPVDPNTDFTITFDTPIENSKNFEVVSAAFPNTFHQFAGYETILYFYHELFQGGSVAIGVPMSITPFLQEGKTGEAVLPSARPAGREQYLDKRYFLDGDDLTKYLNDWIQSLSATGGTDFPAASTGLCPFYFANDDPSQPATFFANEAATSVDFSKLSFTYDNTTALGGTGSLKLVFEDSGGNDVRVASIVDFGYLNSDYYYPSLLSYKLGYTDLQYEAFGAVVNVNSGNNTFEMDVVHGNNFLLNTGVNDSFTFFYTTDGGLADSQKYSIAPPASGYFTLVDLGQAIIDTINAGGNERIVGKGVSVNTSTGVVIFDFDFKNVLVGSDVFVDFSTSSTLYQTLNVAAGQLNLGTVNSSGTNTLPFTTGALVSNYSYTSTNSIIVPINDYSITALSTQITSLFDTVPELSAITVAPATLKLAFTYPIQAGVIADITGYSIVFDVANSVAQACKTNFGFTANANLSTLSTSTTTTFTAPNNVVLEGTPSPAAHLAPDPINLIRTSNIYFASSLSAGEALSSAGRKDILFCVPLTAPIGSVQLYQSTLSGVIVNRPPSVVRNLRVSLLDDNFQIMEAMPQNSSISVEIHFSYDDEANTNNVSTNPYAQKA